MSGALPEPLSKLVGDLQDRGFVITHEVLDRVPEDEDTSVWLELSDGLAAGGKVILMRVAGTWEVMIEVGDRNFWPTYSVSRVTRGHLSEEPAYIDQSYEERRRLTVELLDHPHGDPNARREVLQAARRWAQRELSD